MPKRLPASRGWAAPTYPGLPVTPARTAGDAAGTLVVHPGVVGLVVSTSAAGRYQDSHLPPRLFPLCRRATYPTGHPAPTKRTPCRRPFLATARLRLCACSAHTT